MKAVSVISIARIVGFASTALKYPCMRISEKTRIWRKIAPPKQLKPKLWITRLILWLSFVSIVIGSSRSKYGLLGLKIYENLNRIPNN